MNGPPYGDKSQGLGGLAPWGTGEKEERSVPYGLETLITRLCTEKISLQLNGVDSSTSPDLHHLFGSSSPSSKKGQKCNGETTGNDGSSQADKRNGAVDEPWALADSETVLCAMSICPSGCSMRRLV